MTTIYNHNRTLLKLLFWMSDYTILFAYFPYLKRFKLYFNILNGPVVNHFHFVMNFPTLTCMPSELLLSWGIWTQTLMV